MIEIEASQRRCAAVDSFNLFPLFRLGFFGSKDRARRYPIEGENKKEKKKEVKQAGLLLNSRYTCMIIIYNVNHDAIITAIYRQEKLAYIF
ncbi:hypothetical protein OUZ56_020023 [Daphnia magna]|uniref:Uncharacterized protein n=1 Tax=Daphnia magna TaxID=35525 RepID=A0ABQ9ZEC7_9CRUS|nr:hypothetical protein OUZ56_020023 [Daphnia magna]